ncbi:MAG TPA: hypothetical protein VG826_21840 [Pirellulales bacterium]|nr:hypothetical protein [Pirellulales bacterium]
MTNGERQIEECPFRRPLPGETAQARCDLLANILGVEEETLCRVGRDACQACCRSFPPAAEEMNPVLASMVYERSTRILRRGGVPGCDLRRAEELLLRAHEDIPSEEDCSDVSPGGVDGPLRIAQVMPAPRDRSGPPVRNWAVGVTTAPRGVATLDRCLESLIRAGWPPARLFVDGEVDIPDTFAHLPRTVRQPRIGAWPNYYLALAELLMRSPGADAYLLVQDDSLFCEDGDLRGYLERILWPGKRPGIASLFCSRAYTQPRAGWYEFDRPWLWCALAFVFSRQAAQRFLADLEVVEHRWSRRRNPLADIDWRIGQWAWRSDVPVYYPTPSLVQHIGDVSSLWKGARLHGYRRASWFAGSQS